MFVLMRFVAIPSSVPNTTISLAPAVTTVFVAIFGPIAGMRIRIPDVQRDYVNISLAQQARGIEVSRKQSIPKRIKGAAAILIPLILSSIERIDTVSCAMELRSFGKKEKRSWYNYKPFTRADIVVLSAALSLFALRLWISFKGGNPFLK